MRTQRRLCLTALFALFALILGACDGGGPRDAGRGRDAGTDAGADAGSDAGVPPPLPAPGPTTCPDEGQKRLLFGDLHVHTSYSFDSFFFNSMNGPDEAYAFARGEAAQYPCGDDPDTPCREARLPLPLDFVAVTDHSEFFGLSVGCGVDGDVRPAPLCAAVGTFIRENIESIVAGGAANEGLLDLVRGIGDPVDTWERTVRAANEAYEPCTFTTFVAYEHSPQPNGAMLHRNILFQGTQMPYRAVSSDEAPTEWSLFRQLDALCPPGPAGAGEADCEYLSIPHNANLSDGRMFQSPLLDGDRPATQEQVAQRARVEVLFELFQHKGQSECQPGYRDPLGAEEDLACGFELAKPVCTGAPDDAPDCVEECLSPATDAAEGTPANCTAPLDMARNALVEGLRLAPSYEGINPFQLGFVGATDTHNGDPGSTTERGFAGHGGILDDEPDELLGRWECPAGEETCALDARIYNRFAFDLNPGGLTGVWATQNTREGIFDALRRREAYATSGPRIELRVYAGWDLPADLCDRLAAGAEGIEPEDVGAIPMGATLTGPPPGGAPMIAVNALADPVTGTPLERVEIIKGWVDAAGEGHLEVIAVVGDATGPAPSAACAVETAGEPERLCGVYRDATFDPSERAFYYARVLENPSCRWSTWRCVERGVDCATLDPTTGTFEGAQAGYEGCCDITREGASYRGAFRFDTVEERAWSSAIWY